MKNIKLHTGSTVTICDNGANLCDHIERTTNNLAVNSKEEPFLICDLGDLVKKWNKLIEACPRLQPVYAMQCNNDQELVNIFAKLGVRFSCITKKDARSLLELGVAPDRLIFSNPCKQTSTIRYAVSSSIDLMVFDNENELRKIKQHHPTSQLLLQFNLNEQSFQNTASTGASPSKKLLEIANSVNLQVVGISFNISTKKNNDTELYYALKSAKKIFDEAHEVGHELTLLHIGGEILQDDDSIVLFEESARQLNEILEYFFPSESNIEVMVEASRYFVESAFTAVCKVVSIEHCGESDIEMKYYLNDGVYGSFNSVLIDHQYPVPHSLRPIKTKTKCSVWGPTNDSLDCINRNTFLPKLECGECVYFLNMGACYIHNFKERNIKYVCQEKYSDLIIETTNKPCIPVSITKRLLNTKIEPISPLVRIS